MQQSGPQWDSHMLDPPAGKSQARGYGQRRSADGGVQAGILSGLGGRGIVAAEDVHETGVARDLTEAER